MSESKSKRHAAKYSVLCRSRNQSKFNARFLTCADIFSKIVVHKRFRPDLPLIEQIQFKPAVKSLTPECV